MSEIDQTLNQRQNVHGDFAENSEVTEHLMETIRCAPNWNKLDPVKRTALFHIAHKIGRIMCGDPEFADHWHDIQGYAKCVEDRLVVKLPVGETRDWWLCRCGRKDSNPPDFSCLSCGGSRKDHEITEPGNDLRACPFCSQNYHKRHMGEPCPHCRRLLPLPPALGSFMPPPIP